MTTDQRLERERAFHDKAFSEQTRATVRRYYTVDGALRRWYNGTLASHAPGANTLEYGCGPGSAAFQLAQQGAHVTGIDISPVAIEIATEKARAEQPDHDLRYEVRDAENLTFDDDTFDLVCGSGILHHLDLDRSYAEIARVLRPGGAAVFIEPMGHNPAINWYRNRTPALRTVDEHPLLVADLDRASAFFDSVETHFFTLTSLLAVPFRERRAFPRMVDALNGVDRALFSVIPPSRRWAWMVGMVMRVGN
jgi:SAM-dependent methyltransferase